MKPEEITPQTALSLVRKSNWRRKYRTALREESDPILNKTRKYPLANRWCNVAPHAEGTPEELREVVLMLFRRREQRDSLLYNLLFHPSIPDDVLEHIIEVTEPPGDRAIDYLAHRKLPRPVLEKLVEKFAISEAVATLAYEYARDENVTAEEFGAFLVRHRNVWMMRNGLAHGMDDYPDAKRRIIREVLGIKSVSESG